MTLQTRFSELQSAGRVPLYCYKHATVDLDKADNVQIALGLQPSGRYLHLIDLDSHKPGQNATAARAAFETALPQVASKIEWYDTPRGLHGFFESYKRLPSGWLYDSQGNHIGELLNDGSHTRDHGDIAPHTLSLTDIDHLFLLWSVDCGEPGSAQWKERAKEGAKLTAGYNRIHPSEEELIGFLLAHCGPVGKQLAALFSERGSFDRSAAAGNLMQCLMYNARKLPGGASLRTVMAYWMAAKSYGKASDRDYNQVKDGCSLIAQIVHGDMKKNGKPWIRPSWVSGSTITSAPAPIPAPEPARPAHRPAGDREKHLATFRRVLEAIEPDDFGRRTYTLEYLADKMKIARCAVAPRTIQSYLKALRDAGEIVTAQIDGNGQPYAILKPCFGGADKSEKRIKPSAESPVNRGANEIAPERILTPQTAESSAVCIEDHHKTSAPPLSAYDLARTFFASAVDPLTGEVWERHTFARFKRFVEAHGPCHVPTARRAFAVEQKRARWSKQDAKTAEKVRKMDDSELKRRSRSAASRAAQLHRAGSRQAPVWDRLAGIYAAEEARRAPPDQLTLHEQWAQLGAEYQQAHQALKKHARPVARAARPAGAQDGGAPLSAPAGAPTPGTFDSLMAGIRAYHTGKEAA